LRIRAANSKKSRIRRKENNMDAIKKILVPTDFSAHADEAFRVAHALAKTIGAEVILFHVAVPPAVVSEGGEFLTNGHNGEPLDLWGRFQRIVQTDPSVRVEHQVIVVGRLSARHILEMLDQRGCDLIVMGTHGHSWLKDSIFGSLTEQVVRLARCPVMVVKSPAHKALTPDPKASQKAEVAHAG
jgi:nucleotide-binding universal stress UspA family protein